MIRGLSFKLLCIHQSEKNQTFIVGMKKFRFLTDYIHVSVIRYFVYPNTNVLRERGNEYYVFTNFDS